MFTNTQGKGFAIKFDNGWTVSVQWGPKNYANCDTEETTWKLTPAYESMIRSPNAECAVRDPDGNIVDYWTDKNDPQVNGWMTPNDVMELMNDVASR